MTTRTILIAAALFVGAAALAFVWHVREAEQPFFEARRAPVKILFLGDMMLDRTLRLAGEEHGYEYLFGPIASLLRAHDYAVFNLEGPVTDNPSTSTGSVVGSARNYIFTMDPRALVALKAAAGTTTLIASLGNNHIGNFGDEGIEETHEHLGRLGVGYFGSPELPLEPLFLDTAAGSVSLIGYNEFGGSATGSRAALEGARAAGALPIVFAHWGEEYATSAPRYVEELARGFARAGAALVVGAHPHVVQPPDFEGATPMFYSLGNAFFDQYWEPRVYCGLALSLVLEDGGIASIERIPLKMERSRQTLWGEGARDCASVVGVVQ